MSVDTNNSQSLHPDPCWLAGVRYPSGTEIWCAYRGGEPAWTPDRKLAATYSSQPAAALAARLLTDGAAVPFLTPFESVDSRR